MKKISLIIITYRRDDDLVEAVESSVNMLSHLLAEIIIIDNNDDGLDRRSLFKLVDNVKVIDPKANLGVAGGRNLGASIAVYPYLLFFDDDAVFSDEFNLEMLEQRISNKTVLASNAIRSNGHYAREEYPFFDKSRSRATIQNSARFIGVGHLCSKEVFDKFGGYDSNSFYGMEEFYFSAWLLTNDYQIEYVPGFKLVHKKSDSGREEWDSQSQRMFKNKLGFLKQWYVFPIFIVLAFINYLFFVKKGMKVKSGYRILMNSILLKVAVKVPFKTKIKFMKMQYKIRDYLL
jgi:GT2 family glycosyltransferase